MTYCIRNFAAMACLLAASSALAQDAIDPKLAVSWKFMQASMPGVPATLLEEACREKTLTVYNGTWGTRSAVRWPPSKSGFRA